MTHATIHPVNAQLCAVEFDYNAKLKDAVKALPGASFDGERWIISLLSLPALKAIFSRLDTHPDVVDAYYAQLHLMLAQFATGGFRVWLDLAGTLRTDSDGSGGIYTDMASCVRAHSRGIVAALKQGPPAPVASHRPPPAANAERPQLAAVEKWTPEETLWILWANTVSFEEFMAKGSLWDQADDGGASVQLAPVSEKDLAMWLKGSKNAGEREERKVGMLKNLRRKKRAAAIVAESLATT